MPNLHEFYKDYPSVEKTLALKPQDIIIYNKIIKALDEKESKSALTMLASLGDIPAIIRLANHDSRVNHLCHHPKLKSFWDDVLIKFGETSNTRMAPQVTAHSFDLISGFFFFSHAMKARHVYNMSFSMTELGYLKKAMQFHSAPAVQALNDHANQMIAEEKEPEKHYIEVITRCQELVPFYSSYAYMMLAEAYAKYGLFLQKNNSSFLIKRCIASAKNACLKAELYLQESAVEIHNASLGQGLIASNTLKIASPKMALVKLNGLFSEMPEAKQSENKRRDFKM
jgi:hypothetical protein